MPFTFSHPALVLPLKYVSKKWFSTTGLVIGSLTPDFEYFLRMRIKSDYSHTISEVFWFDLPLGLLLAFIFHNSVRNTLFDQLPTFFKSRFIGFKSFNWNGYFKEHWFIVITSILIGAFSHILWDSFTHDDGFFVKRFSVLSDSIVMLNHTIPLLKILQHASTLLGGIVIAYTVYKLPKKAASNTGISSTYWIIFVLLMLVIISIRLYNGLELKQYGHVIVTAIASGMIALLLTSVLTKKKMADVNS
ncbi:DUF4184 family protein [Sphingobacterium sp. SRCM116780]|uniref:DUF4184 family protein n=1 Tax=Sphingobacterium sp. SRCM116780 TaxID=2907623 RepID=UPI001F1FF64C|nr:DUF4184 family protein [Sphingobacterium sp. SRCM116780]UIR57322.1 DUF4184 family protein [Sphingobacterium sp. SRCM116780]